MCNKTTELKVLIQTNSPDLILITESHCSQLIPDASISFDGFNLIRADRAVGRKGGVLLLYRSDLPIVNINVNPHPYGSWEGLSCEILMSQATTLKTCLVYRSPGTLSDDAASDFLNFLKDSRPPNNLPFLLAGDFNFPTIDWNTYTSTGSALASNFLDFLLDDSLTQHVSFPTRFRADNRPSLLDLVITNSNHNIAHIDSYPPLGKSDHVVIAFDLTLCPTSPDLPTTRFNYSKADYILINEMISNNDWKDEFTNVTAAEAFSILDQFLADIRNVFVPLATTSFTRKPKWLSRPAKTAVNRKKRAWDRYKRNPSPTSYKIYTSAGAVASLSISKAKQDFEKKLLCNSAKNPKQFFLTLIISKPLNVLQPFKLGLANYLHHPRILLLK